MRMQMDCWSDRNSAKIDPIKMHGKIAYRVRYRTALDNNGGYRDFETEEDARQFIANGISYSLPEKGKEIPIGGEKNVPQFEQWTERFSESEMITVEMTVYHFGFFSNSLAMVETCFFSRWPNDRNYVPKGTIMVIIPKGTEIDWYGNEEIRFIPDKRCKVYHCKTGWLKPEK